MSLVHEALEKAAREKQRKTGVVAVAARGSGLPAATPPAPSGSGLPTATPRRSRLPWLLAGVALIAVLAALWFAAKAYRQVEQALTPPPLAPAAPVKIVEPAPVVVPPVPVVESRFKLTGIVRMPEGEYSAVINGKPMYETQYVDGAIVKKIERDRVTLDVDGKETVLRLF
jgi:hypothetical protein